MEDLYRDPSYDPFRDKTLLLALAMVSKYLRSIFDIPPPESPQHRRKTMIAIVEHLHSIPPVPESMQWKIDHPLGLGHLVSGFGKKGWKPQQWKLFGEVLWRMLTIGPIRWKVDYYWRTRCARRNIDEQDFRNEMFVELSELIISNAEGWYDDMDEATREGNGYSWYGKVERHVNGLGHDVRNRLLNKRRTEGKYGVDSETTTDPEVVDFPADLLVQIDQDPSKKRLLDKLIRAIDELSDPERFVIRCKLNKNTQEQIATELRVSKTKVSRITARAIEQLVQRTAKHLDQDGPGEVRG